MLTLLNNYEKNYCSDEEYAEGFKATLDAVLPLYRSDDFTEDTYAALKAQVQAKVDLYNQILKAEDLDATALARAIEAAKEAFRTLTATEDVTTALEALSKAMNDYSLGLGDITSMGHNMSFEDLSSQNGQQTSGTGPAPTGWNVYVNGNKLDEGSTAGLSNWHGINDDCTGYKDGNYGFGLWMPTIPEYEISQTITGLDKGTYTITAGLMVDRRRTTQRLFGNHNSTLFASEFEYAENILPAEYKTYADLSVVNDDRTMQEISVRAYVYDGTLTFGVRTNGDIAAALRESGEQGDGWFKVDNFTITKDGYFEQDARDLYNYLSDQISEMANLPMDAEFKEKLNADYDDIDEGHETLRTLTLHFGVDESGTATIGFRTDNLNGNTGEVKLNTIDEPGNGYGWFKIDNFTLYYESRKVPTRIETPEIVTGLQADKAVYDLSGRRVEKMSKGVYVRNGKKIVR